MHMGKTLLTHIKDCKKCQYRYKAVFNHRNVSVLTAIKYADMRFEADNEMKKRVGV